MYRCSICNDQTPPHQQQLRHVTVRRVPHLRRSDDGRSYDATREEIAKERPVCVGCWATLTRGKALEELRAEFPPSETEAAPVYVGPIATGERRKPTPAPAPIPLVNTYVGPPVAPMPRPVRFGS